MLVIPFKKRFMKLSRQFCIVLGRVGPDMPLQPHVDSARAGRPEDWVIFRPLLERGGLFRFVHFVVVLVLFLLQKNSRSSALWAFIVFSIDTT